MAKKISMTQVIRTFSDVLGGVFNQASLVTQVCNACDSHFQGDDATKAEVKEIADGVAIERGWSEASARARKSEVRNVVRQYRDLPSRVTAITRDKRCEGFTWHNAVKVARLMKSHGTIKAVTTAYFTEAKSKSATPVQKIEKALLVARDTVTTSAKYKGFQQGLDKLLAKHGIALD